MVNDIEQTLLQAIAQPDAEQKRSLSGGKARWFNPITE